jgi:hypothetical protein
LPRVDTQVFLAGQAGVVMEGCRLYETDSNHMQDLRPKGNGVYFRSSRRVAEPVVTVIVNQLKNYYHWLLEAVP